VVGFCPSFHLTRDCREKKLARSRAIKALDYAMSGPSGSTACETFVDALGLKSLFTTFMGKSSKKNKGIDAPASEETSHTLSIVSSLFTNLPSESPARIRLLAKFVENNYEKVDKLLEIRESAQKRLTDTETDIEQEKKVATHFVTLFSSSF
jgi:beta-catenin-like protein 1